MLIDCLHSTCAISVVRLWALLTFQRSDATYSTIPAALLSQLEPSLLITLGCIPLLRPLLGGSYSNSGTAKFNNTSIITPRRSNREPQRKGRQVTDDLLNTGCPLQLCPHASQIDYSAGVEHQVGLADSDERGWAQGGDDVELGSIFITRSWTIQAGKDIDKNG